MKRKDAIEYVGHHVDDAGSPDTKTITEQTRLVGWQCGFEPMFVAVASYLPGIRLEDQDAEEIATDYLSEIGWLSQDTPREADYIL